MGVGQLQTMPNEFVLRRYRDNNNTITCECKSQPFVVVLQVHHQ